MCIDDKKAKERENVSTIIRCLSSTSVILKEGRKKGRWKNRKKNINRNRQNRQTDGKIDR